jgi:hypothetical protein
MVPRHSLQPLQSPLAQEADGDREQQQHLHRETEDDDQEQAVQVRSVHRMVPRHSLQPLQSPQAQEADGDREQQQHLHRETEDDDRKHDVANARSHSRFLTCDEHLHDAPPSVRCCSDNEVSDGSALSAVATAIEKTRTLIQAIRLKDQNDTIVPGRVASNRSANMLEVFMEEAPASALLQLICEESLVCSDPPSSLLNQIMHLQPHVRVWAEACRCSFERISNAMLHMSSKLHVIGGMLEVTTAQGAMKLHAREEVSMNCPLARLYVI